MQWQAGSEASTTDSSGRVAASLWKLLTFPARFPSSHDITVTDPQEDQDDNSSSKALVSLLGYQLGSSGLDDYFSNTALPFSFNPQVHSAQRDILL